MPKAFPLFIKGFNIKRCIYIHVLKAMKEDMRKLDAFGLIYLIWSCSWSRHPRVYLHEIDLIGLYVHNKIDAIHASENPLLIEIVSESFCYIVYLMPNFLLSVLILEKIPSLLISAISATLSRHFWMSDNLRMQWSDDGSKFSCDCTNSERFKLLKNYFLLKLALQIRCVSIIVLFALNEVSSNSWNSILNLYNYILSI
jgi:hypothetical protein